MASGATTGTVTGVASGAVLGAQMGSVAGIPGAVVGGVVGGLAGLISGSSADAQQENQALWAAYNNEMQYNTNMYNISNSLTIAGINFMLGNMAGQQATAFATYNANMIAMTTEHNVGLLENELERLWTDLDLDLHQLEMFRARERGFIIADQGASGTVIGLGSNAEVVIDQMTQEAMDASIMQFGADRVAADINNNIARSKWEGEVAISQTLWEGEMAAFNANAQSITSLASAIIQANADMYSSKQAYMAGGNNITQAQNYNSATNTQNMISGLFGAATTYSVYQYRNKIPQMGSVNVSGGSLAANNYSSTWGNYVNLGSNKIGTPTQGLAGSSLATGL